MLIATGLNIVLGFLGLLDLGFMAFYAIGAYTMAILSGYGFGFGLRLCWRWRYQWLFGGCWVLRFLRLRGDYLAIVTLGFGEITRIVLNNWDSLTNGPKGISLLTNSNIKPISLFSWQIKTSLDFYYLIVIFVLVGVLVSSRCSILGSGEPGWPFVKMKSPHDDWHEISKMKMIGFVVSAAFAGAAGGIFARWENFVTPESFTFWESVLCVTMVVVGGMGSIPGTLLGVAIVVFIPEVLRNFLSSGFESWRYLILGGAYFGCSISASGALAEYKTSARVDHESEVEKTLP